MKIAVYDTKGTEKEAKDVKVTLFDAVVNPALIHEVVVAQLADRRAASAQTKTRGLVSGGGKKPYKQKGTGRARTGSIRNPIWRGGGTTFGPTGIQNFKQRVLKKKRTGAILSALATRKDAVSILEKFDFTKTKDFAKVVEKITEGRKVLFVSDALNENQIIVSRNLQNVRICDYRNLNVYDVLNADKIVFIGDALVKANEMWGRSTVAQAKGAK